MSRGSEPGAANNVASLAFSRGKQIGEADSRSKNISEKPLTRAISFARIKNCSAGQSAYRAGGGKTSKADKTSLKHKLSNLSQSGDPAIGGRQQFFDN